MLLDPSEHSKYIEDCEVCCRPIEVQALFEDQDLVSFSGESIEQ